MSGSNGKSLEAHVVEILRGLALNKAQAAAVERLEMRHMVSSDKELIEDLADEQLPAADRRSVDRLLRASYYHPHRDPRPASDPAIERALAELYAELATAALATQQKHDVRLIATESLRTAGIDEVEVRRSRLRQAEEDYLWAREQEDRVRSKLVDLLAQRDNRNRALLLAQQTVGR